jgi:hypothetical protein
MDPGNYGIRRFNKTQGDPVLCAGDVCYISQGPDVAAKAMSRFAALGAGNTLGGRAGACRLQLSCVFRDVDLGKGMVEIMPVDLHVLRHDRREVSVVAADPTCVVVDGGLACGATLKSATYRAWIVPEPVAVRAGGEILSAALAGNLDRRLAEAK